MAFSGLSRYMIYPADRTLKLELGYYLITDNTSYVGINFKSYSVE